MAERIVKYCSACGNSGRRMNGSVCTCEAGIRLGLSTASAFPAIPTGFVGVTYNSNLVPQQYFKLATKLMDILDEYDKTGSLPNLLIAMPFKTGKTIFAYDLLTRVALHGEAIAPILDLSVYRELHYQYDDPSKELLGTCNKAKVLVLRVPLVDTKRHIPAIIDLLYERSAESKVTVLLYQGTLQELWDSINSIPNFNSLLKDGIGNSFKLIGGEHT